MEHILNVQEKRNVSMDKTLGNSKANIYDLWREENEILSASIFALYFHA